jgi:hypothetical protein
LHEGPLVADADVQAEYADAASAPTEIDGLDAGQVHELDQGGGGDYRHYAAGVGGGEAGFFMRRPDLSGAGADYEEEEANFVLQRRTITKRSRHPIGPFGPISTYFTKFKF